ncbi:hypothetical protein PR048_033063 [Dryococelus australis]|uniref:Uncharacterized protein n=1 Tax=Dryococelus australis TaxID=614101 RepID=A0ABQ9G2I3_9NEOP|nr:hypothetical protein PR048_033063 [Dryococelus australis]
MKGREILEIPEKTRRPGASFVTIPTREGQGLSDLARDGIRFALVECHRSPHFQLNNAWKKQCCIRCLEEAVLYTVLGRSSAVYSAWKKQCCIQCLEEAVLYTVLGRSSVVYGAWKKQCCIRCLEEAVLYTVLGRSSVVYGAWMKQCCIRCLEEAVLYTVLGRSSVEVERNGVAVVRGVLKEHNSRRLKLAFFL